MFQYINIQLGNFPGFGKGAAESAKTQYNCLTVAEKGGDEFTAESIYICRGLM